MDLEDEAALSKSLLDRGITIVFYLIDAVKHERQQRLIKALASVNRAAGSVVHFLHTTGAKLFSEHAGMPTDQTFYNDNTGLYDLKKASRAPIIQAMNAARETNNVIIETAEALGVRSYIFVPCVVYGEGEGFGNRTSIQTVTVVQAANGLRRVYDVNGEGALWPVSHVLDNTALYRDLLKAMIAGKDVGHGKDGYYLALSGSVKWRDLFEAMAQGLAKRGIVDSADVSQADDHVLGCMGEALNCPKGMVRVQLGGHCSLVARHGKAVGCNPTFTPGHILESADAEVDFILANWQK